MTAWSDIS